MVENQSRIENVGRSRSVNPGVSPVGCSRVGLVQSGSVAPNLHIDVGELARSRGISERNGTPPRARAPPPQVDDLSDSIIAGSMINSPQLSATQTSSTSAAQPHSINK